MTDRRGYQSSDRKVTDLADPPSGLAPGAPRTPPRTGYPLGVGQCLHLGLPEDSTEDRIVCDGCGTEFVMPTVTDSAPASCGHARCQPWPTCQFRHDACSGCNDLAVEVERIVVAREAAARADTWDEGYDAGHRDARSVQETYPELTRNPYRTAPSTKGDR